MRKQKHFRKIPSQIEHKLNQIKTSHVIVGGVAKLPATDIRDGVYEHLGIEWTANGPKFPTRIVPGVSAGRYSEANANGKELVRTDLPKITKTYTFEAPNYGDWSNGSHDVDIDREVYQREFVPPTENEVVIELVGKEGTGEAESFVFRFTLDQPLSKSARNFDDELLRMLNLLQENVGVADVFATDATLDEYLRTIYVNWEILPPGERENNIAKITASVRNADEETRKKIVDRYDFFERMRPQALIQGVGGFRRYFGAKFTDELVAFENMEYGNAVYVMCKDWKEASRKTKQELLSTGREGKDFFRVIHAKGWKAYVQKVIKEHRN